MSATVAPRVVTTASCPACGGHGAVVATGWRDRIYGVGGTWDARRCASCSSRWLDPRPLDDDLHLCYPSQYFTHQEGASPSPPSLAGPKGVVRRLVLASSHGYRHFSPSVPLARHAGRLLALWPALRRRAGFDLEVLLPHWQPGGRLLDVGCGSGHYLSIMRSLGWQVMGSEVDPAAAARARAAYGLDIWERPLEELAAHAAPFDVATLSHVVEHVPDPAGLLRSVTACLRPGGILIVTTPNAGSLGARALKGDWYGWQPPQHLVVFSRGGLRAVVDRVAGLRPVSQGTSSQMARQMWAEGFRVRRYGTFKQGVVPTRVRRSAAAFAWAERLACLVGPYGEELWAVARRQPDGFGA